MSVAYQVKVKSFNGKSEVFIVDADGEHNAVAKATLDAVNHPLLHIAVSEDVEIVAVERVGSISKDIEGTKRYRITKGTVPDEWDGKVSEVLVYETDDVDEAEKRWKDAEIVGHPANADIGDFGRFLGFNEDGTVQTLDEYM